MKSLESCLPQGLSRRQFVGSALAAGATASGHQPAAGRPNVVIMVADDLGSGDVGCFGATEAKTPHLDRLAREGVRFTDWHANSPVCSPSRASLLTGQYPQHCGIPEILFSKPDFSVPGLRKGERTLASELKQAGYRTAAIGKWHLGSSAESRPRAQGFDSFFGFYSGWTDYYSHRYYTLGGQPIFHDLWRDDAEVFEEPVYQTELLAREATGFIGQQRAEQPFFLYLAFGAPHYPMMAPKQYLDRFPETLDRDRRMHLAMVAAVDDAVGQVRFALDRRGYTQNTVVFFVSDNGATRELRADHRGRPYSGGSNLPFRASKGSLFEGGTRVPALLAYPGMIKPRADSTALLSMDMMPTILQVAGLQTPASVDGADLSKLLIQGTPLPNRTVFWEYAGQSAAREGRWKLLTSHREGLGQPLVKGPWLSDLLADPGETRNFAQEQPSVVARLADALATWRAKYP
ncbi:MAG TPA: sulfatase-like hydrolase/transferase [Bryobacteraceae bacterium]|nr:sulfatase-like hydrolase/transferase [Bryobacteraceae bacterium]